MGAELLEYYKQNNAHIKYHTNDIHSHDNPFGLEGWWSLFRGLEV